MSKILIVGCSASDTCGWKDPAGKVWWHPLSTEFGGVHTVTNLSRNGNTNHDVMLSVINETSINSYDLVVAQWTGFYRQNFYLSKSLTAADRVYFGLMPARPIELSRKDLKGSKHEKSLIHWQENFVNVRHFYNANLSYAIATATYLSCTQIPFVFLNNIGGGVHFNDIVEPNWKNTSTAYRNEVLLWPVCGDKEAELGHNEIYQKMLKLKAVSEKNWANLDRPYNPRTSPDLSEDGFHPGIETSRLMREGVIDAAHKLGYNML